MVAMVMRLLAAPLKPETGAVSVRKEAVSASLVVSVHSVHSHRNVRVGDHMMPWS